MIETPRNTQPPVPPLTMPWQSGAISQGQEAGNRVQKLAQRFGEMAHPSLPPTPRRAPQVLGPRPIKPAGTAGGGQAPNPKPTDSKEGRKKPS